MFKFTEEQLMIRDMVKEFTANEVEPRDRDMDENGFDFDLIPKLVDAGLMAIHLPEQYGGGGGDTITSEIVINEIAKGSASIALFLDAHWLAADMILYHGTDEQKAKYLPLVAEGKVFAFGLTESNAGSDAGAIKSVAEKQPDGSYILNGGKAWITNSGIADYYLIMAKTDPEAGNKGISVFVVPKDAEGLTVGKFEKKMGMRGTGTCELSFDNIHIPAEDRVGPEGRGFMMRRPRGQRFYDRDAGSGRRPCVHRRHRQWSHAARHGQGCQVCQGADHFRQAHLQVSGCRLQVCRYGSEDPRHCPHDLGYLPDEGRGQAHLRGSRRAEAARLPLGL